MPTGPSISDYGRFTISSTIKRRSGAHGIAKAFAVFIMFLPPAALAQKSDSTFVMKGITVTSARIMDGIGQMGSLLGTNCLFRNEKRSA